MRKSLTERMARYALLAAFALSSSSAHAEKAMRDSFQWDWTEDLTREADLPDAVDASKYLIHGEPIVNGLLFRRPWAEDDAVSATFIRATVTIPPETTHEVFVKPSDPNPSRVFLCYWTPDATSTNEIEEVELFASAAGTITQINNTFFTEEELQTYAYGTATPLPFSYNANGSADDIAFYIEVRTSDGEVIAQSPDRWSLSTVVQSDRHANFDANWCYSEAMALNDTTSKKWNASGLIPNMWVRSGGSTANIATYNATRAFKYTLPDGRFWATTNAAFVRSKWGSYANANGSLFSGNANSFSLVLYNFIGASLVSPKIEGGIGTIYFNAQPVANANRGSFDIEISRSLEADPANIADDDWHSITNIIVEKGANPTFDDHSTNCKTRNNPDQAGNTHRAEFITLNDPTITRVRFIRKEKLVTTVGVAHGVVLDDIIFSPIPPDVEMRETLKNPGYPSRLDDMTVRCVIKNTTAARPIGYDVSVWYQHVAQESDPPVPNAWTNAPMHFVEAIDDELYYEGTIPAQPAGHVHYFFKCDFEGFHFGADPDNFRAKARYHSENNSPRYFANGKTLKNEEEPPKAQSMTRSTKQKIDVFRKNHEEVWLDLSYIGYTNIFDITDYKVPMELVADNEWQALVNVKPGAEIEGSDKPIPVNTNSNVEVQWFFRGSKHYSDNASSFAVLPDQWGVGAAQTTGYLPPASGYAAKNETYKLSTELVHDGYLLMRLKVNEDDASLNPFSIKRGIYQNFETWVANEQFFEESSGLFGTVTLLETFDGDDGDGQPAWEPDEYADDENKTEDFQDETLSAAEEGGNPLHVPFTSDETATFNNWMRSNSKLIKSQKTIQEVIDDKDANISLVLSAGLDDGSGNTVGRGTLYNTGYSMSRGLRDLTFRARSTLNRDKMMIFNFDPAYSWQASTTATYYLYQCDLSDYADTKASFSLIMLYSYSVESFVTLFGQQIPTSVKAKYYELRFTKPELDSASIAETKLNLELLYAEKELLSEEPVAPTYTKIAEKTLTNCDFTSTAVIKVTLTRATNNRNTFTVDYYNSGTFPTSGSNVSGTRTATTGGMTDTDGTHPGNGTVGFASYDLAAKISRLRRHTTDSPDYIDNAALPVNEAWTTGNEGGGWVTPPVPGAIVERVAPPSRITIESAPQSQTTQPSADPMQWSTAGSRDITGLKFNDYTIPFDSSSSRFVRLTCTSAELYPAHKEFSDAVIDDPCITSWRAHSRTIDEARPNGNDDYLNWNEWESDQFEKWLNNFPVAEQTAKWVVYEGWITEDEEGNKSLELTPSRARDGLDQCVVSPRLINGIGSISFNAAVTGSADANAEITFAVEYSNPSGEATWSEAARFTMANGERASKFTAIRTPELDDHGRQMYADWDGRIRIRVIPELSAKTLTLNLDNLKVRNHPPASEASWQGYNILVTSSTDSSTVDGDYSRLFSASQSCFFNINSTNETAGVPYPEYASRLTSAVNHSGIGEVAFWYRPLSAEQPAIISVCAANEQDAPEEDWHQMFTLFATNSVTPAFEYFTTGSDNYFKRYKYARFTIVTNISEFVVSPATPCYMGNSLDFITSADELPQYISETGLGQAIIDNITIIEPVRPEIVFEKVDIEPKLWGYNQPLVGTNVTLSVRAREGALAPTDARIFVDYCVTTNNWGYTNWWDRQWSNGAELTEYTKNGITVKRLELDGSLATGIFTNKTGEFLPSAQVDDVVQFIVWATHADIENYAPNKPKSDPTQWKDVCFMSTNIFTNPEWYYPVDLNKRYGDDGWSPYYFVYSCAPGRVWINEINYYAGNRPDDPGDFVEIVGPANVSLKNWQLQLVEYEPSAPIFTDNEGVTPPLKFTTDWSFKNLSKGWGFFVWGDKSFEGKLAAKNPNIGFASFGENSDNVVNMFNDNGLILIRSNGAYEHRIAWGSADKAAYWNSFGFDHIGMLWVLGYQSLSLQNTELSEGGSTYRDFVWLYSEDEPALDESFSSSFGEMNTNQDLSELEPSPGGDDDDPPGPPTGGAYTIYSRLDTEGGTHELVNSTRDQTLPATTGDIEYSVENSNDEVTVTYRSEPGYRIESFTTNNIPVEGFTSMTNLFIWSPPRGNTLDITNNVTFAMTNSFRLVSNIDDGTGYQAYYLDSTMVSFGKDRINRVCDLDSDSQIIYYPRTATVEGATISYRIRYLTSNGVEIPEAVGVTAPSNFVWRVPENPPEVITNRVYYEMAAYGLNSKIIGDGKGYHQFCTDQRLSQAFEITKAAVSLKREVYLTYVARDDNDDNRYRIGTISTNGIPIYDATDIIAKSYVYYVPAENESTLNMTATFLENKYLLTSSVGVGGTQSLNGSAPGTAEISTKLVGGNDSSVTFTADEGYAIDSITVNGEVVCSGGTTYTWHADTADPYNNGVTLSAAFVSSEAPTTFTVVSAALTNGKQSISINGSALSGASADAISATVAAGSNVKIVYYADDWFRVGDVTSNDHQVFPDTQLTTFTRTFEWTASVGGNILNEATFIRCDNDPTRPGAEDEIPVEWLSQFGSEAEISAADDDAIDLIDEYLLNTDPTLSTEYDFLFSEVAFDPADESYALLEVTLRRKDDGVAITRPINGAVAIFGAQTLAELKGIDPAQSTYLLFKSAAGTLFSDGTTAVTLKFEHKGNTYFRTYILKNDDSE